MRGLAKETIELIMFARMLLAELNPMTLRQLHYSIFSAARIDYDNTQKEYKRLSRVTSRARRDYRAHELAGNTGFLDSELLIPPDWMVDEQRQPEIVTVWTDAEEYMATVRDSYRRDYWQHQPNYVEVWSEKQTILGSLRPVARKLGVTLRACKGFGSTGMETQIGNLFEGISKPISVFFLGDHDPSGHVIEADIHRRAQIASGKKFEMTRLAIHASDIEAYNLPQQRIKPDDKRAAGFERRFGANAPTVELDALPVEVLRERVDEAIREKIDREIWNRQVSVEEVELACIARIADTVKNLPQVER
jgi:hypothetical protein